MHLSRFAAKSTRQRLSQLLIASHLGALLLFAGLLLASGGGTIRTAVVGQARTEAERGVNEARQRILDGTRELGVTAGLLAEQPTLRYYLQTRQLTKARELVGDFHGTSDVNYLRVEWDGEVLASLGTPPPQFTTGLAFDRGGAPWRILRRDIPDLPGAAIVVAQPLGERLRADAGFVDVSLHPLPAPSAAPDADPLMDAVRTVAESGEPTTLESLGPIAAMRIVRLRSPTAEPAAILSASVPQDWVRRRVLEWHAAFGASMALALLLAMALASLVASRIARPFAKVADDATRLGDGDLQTAVPRPETFLVEPVLLADSLEKMRVQVASSNAAERRQREELDTVLDGVDEGILAVDREDRVHYANRQVLELLKRPREEVLGKQLREVVEPLQATPSGDSGDAALPVPDRYTAPGLMRPLTVRRLPAGDDRQVLVVREENAIEAARAMRDRILANLSHEFQTPLSAQIASIELLRDYVREAADPVAMRLVDAQYRGTVRLSQLVENLLDSVRIESGEMRLRRQRVDLAQVAADALALMQPLIGLRGQRVVQQLPKGPAIVGDAQRLHSTIVNLLANANKFSHTGSTIWLEIEWQADSVTIWVEDQGPGLPPSLSVRDLFAPFLRAPNEEPSQRGSGLGLAIVHAIVAAHGGQVRVHAPMHGGGARLGISLPVAEEA
jgi:signal transduction histidine kinase